MIYKSLTGIDGYFDTRVVFVQEEGPKSQRVKKSPIMDQDGYNPRPLTDGNELVLTPSASRPPPNEITYMSFGSDTPRVYLIEHRDTRQREIVGEFPNMSFSAALLARWPARHHEPAGRRQFEHLRASTCVRAACASSPTFRPSHRAQLFARRQPDHLRIRPRRPTLSRST